MRTYSDAEKCMMLLYAPLGEQAPLRKPLFRELRQMLTVLGQAEGEQVTRQELSRLGLSPEDAELVLSRLDTEEALEEHLRQLRRQGITLVTRISPEYPQKLRGALGDSAPMLLYCAGNLSLFQREGVSLVGSRALREPGYVFSRRVGAAAAREGLLLISGGAEGADTEGFLGAYEQGGSALLFVADSLLQRKIEMRKELASGRLLLVSEYGFDQHFSALRAHSRNRLIHAMGEKTFVAQSDYGAGGTWSGTMENLKHGWSPVFVCLDEPEDPGAKGLAERGAVPVKQAELGFLRDLTSEQTRLF